MSQYTLRIQYLKSRNLDRQHARGSILVAKLSPYSLINKGFHVIKGIRDGGTFSYFLAVK